MICCKRLILTALLCLVPMLSTACGIGEQTPEGYVNAPLSHVHDHWRLGAASPIPFIIIDVRTPEEFAKGHIPGATLIPVQQLADRIDEVPHNKQVYLYCHSGARSSRAAALLAQHGFTRIENMVGGIVAWKKAGYEVKQ